jgi:uncharacterized pyridoxal phosphate-containing UPF0001 family protein
MSVNIKNYKEVVDFVQQTSPQTTFIAVTKNRGVDDIEELINLGHVNFGENRAQEAIEKFTHLKNKHPNIVLHFIGNLQSNKVKDLLKIVDVFHTLESNSSIDQFEKHKNLYDFTKKQFFVQVNIANEAQKGGVLIEHLSDFLSYSKQKTIIFLDILLFVRRYLLILI